MADRVQVREISDDEGRRLLKMVRRSSGLIVTWRRAQIVLWSAQQMDVPQIAALGFTSEDRAREVTTPATPQELAPHHGPYRAMLLCVVKV